MGIAMNYNLNDLDKGEVSVVQLREVSYEEKLAMWDEILKKEKEDDLRKSTSS